MSKAPNGNGTIGTTISWKPEVIEALDRYCSRHDVNRSDACNQAVKLFLRMKDDECEAWLDYLRRTAPK